MMEQVTAETLSILLGLSGMSATKYALELQGGQEVLHIFCQHQHAGAAVCPRCGGVSEALCEQEERCIPHLELWGRITYVHFSSRRFGCKNCGKSFRESLSWVESKRRKSTSYKFHMQYWRQESPNYFNEGPTNTVAND